MATARSAADRRPRFLVFARGRGTEEPVAPRARPPGGTSVGRRTPRRLPPLVLRLALAVFLCILLLRADNPADDAAGQGISAGYIEPGRYPVYSARFTGTPSPFHETVAALIAKGARRQPAAVARHLWDEGLGHSAVGGYHLPIYTSAAAAPVHVFACVAYGTCPAAGLHVHLPAGAQASADSDHHLIVIDEALAGEVDGWGGDGNPAHRCNVSADTLTCSWGGFFPFSGNGLDGNSGASANNGGYAFGLFVVTAQELLRGRIDHALGMVASCLDNPDIYPADTTKKTDTSCSGGTNAQNPQYGQLVRLRPSYDIGRSAYSPECRTYLAALQKYGAYTFDTNGHYGIALATDDTASYARPNPWYTKIFPDMVRYGDGAGTGSHFRFESCLNRLDASDIDVYDIAPGS